MTERLKIVGKNINLNAAEKQIMDHLQEGADLTEQEALDQVLMYIREQVYVYEKAGNYALAQHLLERIDEWNDVHAERYKELDKPIPKIYLPS